MHDLIDRQAAIDALCKTCMLTSDYKKCEGYKPDSHWCEEITALREVPSAQPEIIRCKDCKYHTHMWNCEAWNNSPGFPVVSDDMFCSLAERRTDEQID